VDFFLVEPCWVDDLARAVEAGRVGVGILCDLASDGTSPGDPYARLAWLARECGVRLVNDPVQAAHFSDKGAAHAALTAAGLPLPFGLTVRADELDTRVLTPEERGRLGEPFYIKPCHGFACRGVLADGREIADVRRSQAACADTHYLLQRRVEVADISGRPAYWRVFSILGDVRVCWWHPATRHYALVTGWQVTQYQLRPLFDLGRRLAALTGLELFSVEVARRPDGAFRLIDYVNDQIDLRAQSFAADGLPDELVRHVAAGLADAAGRELGRRPAIPAADVLRERLQDFTPGDH